MKLAEGIRRVGFRKWYERELLLSHAHLAFTFLCLVGVFAAFETVRSHASWGERLLDVASGALCVAAGVWALRRYLYLLNHAEMAAHQAECGSCGVYARLELVHRDAQGDTVQVRCRSCQHVWEIDS